MISLGIIMFPHYNKGLFFPFKYVKLCLRRSAFKKMASYK